MLVFPSNPALGDRFESWIWNGEKWTCVPQGGGAGGSLVYREIVVPFSNPVIVPAGATTSDLFTIMTLALAPGEWMISANLGARKESGGTNHFKIWLTENPSAPPDEDIIALFGTVAPLTQASPHPWSMPLRRRSLTQPINLCVAVATMTVSTDASFWGYIAAWRAGEIARRMR